MKIHVDYQFKKPTLSNNENSNSLEYLKKIEQNTQLPPTTRKSKIIKASSIILSLVLPTVLTIYFGITSNKLSQSSSKLGEIANQIASDSAQLQKNTQPLNYVLTNFQNNVEKVPQTPEQDRINEKSKYGVQTLNPFFPITLTRNNSGLATEFFVARFNSITSESPEIVQALSKSDSPKSIDLSLFTAFYTSNSDTINLELFDNKLMLFEKQNPQIIFVILKGINNEYQVITLITQLSKTSTGKDIKLDFNGLDLFSDYTWDSKIQLNYLDKTNELEEVKKTLKPQAQTEYSKVVKFIQNNT